MQVIRHSAIWLLFIFSVSTGLLAQPDATPADVRMEGFKTRQALFARSIVQHLDFKSIGPTIFSGRITDIDVDPSDPSHFYVAYASGGLWFTKNNGTTFEPLFDEEAVMTIGDIAVDWQRNTIWVGTGENNSSRSSYSGVGMYRSVDGGKTWIHTGLPESHHISRIVLHPEDPDILWVAVIGHLYSANGERGVYKSTDGGQSWDQVLFVSPECGAIDLIPDPGDPDILYAATWHRERKAWNFVESGEGSGIYRSGDGGNTWGLLTTEDSGFPTGEGVGRIGLAITRTSEGRKIYAILDNYDRRPPEEEDADLLTKSDLRDLSPEAFLRLDSARIHAYLEAQGFPEKYSVDTIRHLIEEGQITPQTLVEYTEDANAQLFETPVVGAEVYASDDEGKTWYKTHADYLDMMYYSYGYYFGQIRVSPHDPDKIYILGVPILISEDGGKTFRDIGGDNVHADHHALWLNPARDKHLILGNDGGINISYDDGANWIKCNSPAVGQFYTVAVDMQKPYQVYGGLQDNGVWAGPNNYRFSTRWHSSGQYPYTSVMGGDGMQVEIDTRNNQLIYTGFQFGNYFRINRSTGERKYITPKHELGERPYRWNWQTPIQLSGHNQDILYMGSNFLHRSMDKGETFEIISPDLTGGGRSGDVPYGTLTSISESPLQFGLIYTGSDDGHVHVTKDGGATWQRISDPLPQKLWVSRVVASSHDKARVYLTLNGYRWDNFTAFVYASEDYGQTWRRICTDLPPEPVNVIVEDPTNENILYVGTDHAVYCTLDRGQTSMGMGANMPSVPVHDIVVHPRDRDLLIGTHGRSFYKTGLEQVQQLDDALLARNLHLFAIPESGLKYSENWGKAYANWREPDTPQIRIPLYVKDAGNATLSVLQNDIVLKQWDIQCDKGLNYPEYDLSVDKDAAMAIQEKQPDASAEEKDTWKAADNGKIYLRPGSYAFRLEKDGNEATTPFQIKD